MPTNSSWCTSLGLKQPSRDGLGCSTAQTIRLTLWKSQNSPSEPPQRVGGEPLDSVLLPPHLLVGTGDGPSGEWAQSREEASKAAAVKLGGLCQETKTDPGKTSHVLFCIYIPCISTAQRYRGPVHPPSSPAR